MRLKRIEDIRENEWQDERDERKRLKKKEEYGDNEFACKTREWSERD